jgi:2-oxoglutarate ferredoxin oxidoreductase subunit delta
MDVTKKSAAPAKQVVVDIEVDRDLCKCCGICGALCPSTVFDRDERGGPVLARLADCTSCQFCERHCPDLAISLVWGAARRRRKPPRAAERPAAVPGGSPAQAAPPADCSCEDGA